MSKEQAVKHDGDLGYGQIVYYLNPDDDAPVVIIAEGLDKTILFPEQALSLLAWIQQEEALLRQWTKESMV